MFTFLIKCIRKYLPEIPYPTSKINLFQSQSLGSVFKKLCGWTWKGFPHIYWNLLWPPPTKMSCLRYCMPQNAKESSEDFSLKLQEPSSEAGAPLFGATKNTGWFRPKMFGQTSNPPGGRWKHENDSNLPMRRRSPRIPRVPVVKVERMLRSEIAVLKAEWKKWCRRSPADCKLYLPLRSLKETHLPTMIFQGSGTVKLRVTVNFTQIDFCSLDFFSVWL